jgi:hypothetical protein
MRLWSLHPSYLDPMGLVALWREALLAQKVLMGETRGYTAHPQLIRFRAHPDPLSMIVAYLHGVYDEARNRGYRFDSARIGTAPLCGQVEETKGQIIHEWAHLLGKLKKRAPALYEEYLRIELPGAHPLFKIVPGEKRDWERG